MFIVPAGDTRLAMEEWVERKPRALLIGASWRRYG